MTTPPSKQQQQQQQQPAVSGEDCVELRKIGDRASAGSAHKPQLGSPSRKKTGGKSVGGLRRLSTISEQEADKLDGSHASQESWAGGGIGGGGEWTASSFSVCSDKLRSSSGRFSSEESFQSEPGDDCAALLLACLHCRFHEFMVLLPDTCERAVSRCFPSYRYIRWSAEGEQSEKDCCSHKLEMDCNCCGSCRETGEFMEFAMEISEVCYR